MVQDSRGWSKYNVELIILTQQQLLVATATACNAIRPDSVQNEHQSSAEALMKLQMSQHTKLMLKLQCYK